MKMVMQTKLRAWIENDGKVYVARDREGGSGDEACEHLVIEDGEPSWKPHPIGGVCAPLTVIR